MIKVEEKSYGKIALGLSLGGVVLAVLVALLANYVKPGSARSVAIISYLVFFTFQISAFILGFIAKDDVVAKVACITSASLFILSFAFL